MDLATLRQAVEEVVLPYLGTYDNGDKAVTTGEPPSDLVVAGIECVIDLLPQISSVPTPDSAHVLREWTVRLIDHASESAALLEPLEALLTRFPFAQVDQLQNSPADGIDPQISIRIPDRIRVGLPRR